MKKIKFIKILFVTYFFIFIHDATKAQNIKFDKYYTFLSNNTGIGTDVMQLNDSGFLVVGTLGQTSPTAGAYCIRTNKFGDTLWTKYFYGGAIHNLVSINDTLFGMAGGLTNLPGSLMFVDINGDTSEFHQYSPNDPIAILKIKKTYDEGFICANAVSGSWAAHQYQVLKLDSIGNEQWHRYVNMSECINVIQTSDSGFLAVGNLGQQFYSWIKMDKLGNTIWEDTLYSNPWGLGPASAVAAIELPDSNYLVACQLGSPNLFKLNHLTGDTIWSRTYSLAPSGFLILNNGHYILNNVSNFWEINTNGDTLSNIYIPGYYYAWSLIKCSDNGFAYTGYKYIGSSKKFILVKTDSLGFAQYTSVFDFPDDFSSISCYPNPANTVLQINTNLFLTEKNIFVTLSNLQGKQMMQEQFDKTQPIVVSNLPNGIYIAELRGKNKVIRDKIIIQH